MKCPNCRVELALSINETEPAASDGFQVWEERLLQWELLLSNALTAEAIDAVALTIGTEIMGSDCPPSVRAKLKDLGARARARIAK